jgi:hypothetical protein
MDRYKYSYYYSMMMTKRSLMLKIMHTDVVAEHMEVIIIFSNEMAIIRVLPAIELRLGFNDCASSLNFIRVDWIFVGWLVGPPNRVKESLLCGISVTRSENVNRVPLTNLLIMSGSRIDTHGSLSLSIMILGWLGAHLLLIILRVS